MEGNENPFAGTAGVTDLASSDPGVQCFLGCSVGLDVQMRIATPTELL